MQQIICKHVPTFVEKALYWAHVIWNHNVADFDFVASQNQVVRSCLLVDWIDGVSEQCPECTPGPTVHLHHLSGMCDDD